MEERQKRLLEAWGRGVEPNPHCGTIPQWGTAARQLEPLEQEIFPRTCLD